MGAVAASAADTDVQRQLQLREQRQLELMLKMRQQQDRPLHRPPSFSAEVQRRQLERNQEQRLQQSHDRELRGTIAPVTPEALESHRREAERQRAIQSGSEQLNRFGAERQLRTERSTPSDSTAP